jgi:hypothetical protein
VAKIGCLSRPRVMARCIALEPAHCFESIEMLEGYPVQMDISGHGLRARGRGSRSSKISWSLPQCGHFNILPVISGYSFSVSGIGRPDIMAAIIIEPANLLMGWVLDLCQIP